MLVTGELESLSRPGMEKGHQRITRRSFLAWCARSISVPPDEFVTTLRDLSLTLSRRQREALVKSITASLQ